jgi:hypothetical protein
MPRSKQFLLEQIARAQRFAKAMNTEADRECFEKMAADYQGTGVRGIGGGSIVCRSDRIAVRGPTNGIAKAQPGTANCDAIEQTATAEDDEDSTASLEVSLSHESDDESQSYKDVQAGDRHAEANVCHDDLRWNLG